MQERLLDLLQQHEQRRQRPRRGGRQRKVKAARQEPTKAAAREDAPPPPPEPGKEEPAAKVISIAQVPNKPLVLRLTVSSAGTAVAGHPLSPAPLAPPPCASPVDHDDLNSLQLDYELSSSPYAQGKPREELPAAPSPLKDPGHHAGGEEPAAPAKPPQGGGGKGQQTKHAHEESVTSSRGRAGKPNDTDADVRHALQAVRDTRDLVVRHMAEQARSMESASEPEKRALQHSNQQLRRIWLLLGGEDEFMGLHQPPPFVDPHLWEQLPPHLRRRMRFLDPAAASKGTVLSILLQTDPSQELPPPPETQAADPGRRGDVQVRERDRKDRPRSRSRERSWDGGRARASEHRRAQQGRQGFGRSDYNSFGRSNYSSHGRGHHSQKGGRGKGGGNGGAGGWSMGYHPSSYSHQETGYRSTAPSVATTAQAAPALRTFSSNTWERIKSACKQPLRSATIQALTDAVLTLQTDGANYLAPLTNALQRLYQLKLQEKEPQWGDLLLFWHYAYLQRVAPQLSPADRQQVQQVTSKTLSSNRDIPYSAWREVGPHHQRGLDMLETYFHSRAKLEPRRG